MAGGGSGDRVSIVSLSVVLLVGIVYLVVWGYSGVIKRQMATSQASMDTLKQQLATDKTFGVVDFLRRSEEIGQHVKGMLIPSETLTDLETTTLTEVTVATYDYDATKSEVKVSAVADAVRNVARQIVAYKSKFSDIGISKVTVNKEGTIDFELTMTWKGSPETPVSQPAQ